MLVNLILYFGFLNLVFGVNLLYICPLPSPSHQIFNYALGRALAEKGYNVTLVGPDKLKVPHKNLHLIHLDGE